MPRAKVASRFDSPTVDVFIDMGHPFWNRTVDSFLKIGLVSVNPLSFPPTNRPSFSTIPIIVSLTLTEPFDIVLATLLLSRRM